MKYNAPHQTASLDRWLRRVPFSSNEGAGQVNADKDGDGQHGPEPGDDGRGADGHLAMSNRHGPNLVIPGALLLV